MTLRRLLNYRKQIQTTQNTTGNIANVQKKNWTKTWPWNLKQGYKYKAITAIIL